MADSGSGAPRGLRGWLERLADQQMGWQQTTGQERHALVLFLLDGGSVALGGAFNTTFVPLYALAMGAGAFEVGLLSSLAGATGIVGSMLAGVAARYSGSTRTATLLYNRLGDPLCLALEHVWEVSGAQH